MKLVVVGASGGTGRCILDLALAAGHDVLALARKPEAIPLRDHLAVEQGDVLVAEDVASAVQGADAVLSAFGPASNRQPGTLMSRGVANMIAGAMFSALRADKRIAEQASEASALDYVIVRPPVLSHEPARGDYKHGAGLAINAAAKLPHADVAAFMIACASDPSVVRTIQNIGR